MERSSTRREEEVAERRATLNHPCYFLEAALKALLKCLGIETETKKEEKSSHLKPHSDADLDPVTTPEASATNIMKSNQEAADPPPTTTQNVNVYDTLSLYLYLQNI